MADIILASGSPRRQELFNILGVDYMQIPPDTEEIIYANEPPENAVIRLAVEKAEAVGTKINNGIIVSADTIVVYNDMILGKPTDQEEAYYFLSLLSGKVHQVLTAICLKNINTGFRDVRVEKTLVYFRNLTHEEIKAYIATGESLDKAGAYAVQGKGALLIKRIEGCYFNVVGLPLTTLYLMLRNQGFNLLEV